MNLFFSDQKIGWDRSLPSIFLAGPTPRDPEVLSWRMEAIHILQELGFGGIVLVPERHNWQVKYDYTDQVEWELEGLYCSNCVAFWVPRELKTLPGFTTNVEFGALVANRLESQRVVYGRPDISHKNRYLDWFFNRHTGRSPYRTLNETLANAIVTAIAQHRLDLEE